MAATIEIHEHNGAGPASSVNKTSGQIRFKAAGDSNADLNNPIVRPTGAPVFSFEKSLQLYMEAPPTGNITNPRAYSDGSNGFGTGITMEAGISASYVNPDTAGQTDSSIATIDFFTKTVGSPLAMNDTDTGPWDVTDDDTYIGDFLYLQAEVASTAVPGLSPSETLTIAFDES